MVSFAISCCRTAGAAVSRACGRTSTSSAPRPRHSTRSCRRTCSAGSPSKHPAPRQRPTLCDQNTPTRNMYEVRRLGTSWRQRMTRFMHFIHHTRVIYSCLHVPLAPASKPLHLLAHSLDLCRNVGPRPRRGVSCNYASPTPPGPD